MAGVRRSLRAQRVPDAPRRLRVQSFSKGLQSPGYQLAAQLQNMANQIAKTTQNLTSAADMRETTQMLMQPNSNWEEYLTPAPLSIAIMGELAFISSCQDFSINKNPPRGRFQVHQVCNSGWQAFNEAHNNMDQIRIHTAAVPDYMKSAVNILFNASDEVIENLLPCQLHSINDIAKQCVDLAGGVEKKYQDVIHQIQEMLEACFNAKHFYGEELENVKRKLEEAKLREQTSRQLKERSKKAMDDLSKELDNAQDAYKSAMDSIPSGWEMIGMDLVEGITSGITAVINGLTGWMGNSSKAARPSVASDDDGAENNILEQIRICSKSEEMLKLTSRLKTFVLNEEINWTDLYDQEKKSCVKAVWIHKQFKRIQQDLLNLPRDKLCQMALSICEKGMYICDTMDTYGPERPWDESKSKDLIKKINKVHKDAIKFDTKSKKMLNSPALTPKPPMMFREQSSSGQASASQRASDNARYRIELSREQLKHTRDSYQKSVENMEKNERELTEILCEMQNCNIKQIDFDTTIKMLAKGLDAMLRVKEQWEKMVRFFQMVSNIVKTSLSVTLKNFANTCDGSRKLGYNDKLFNKDLLYNQAFQASNIASLVHMISGTYTEVSSKFLMDRVSSLGRLMTMDKESPEFEWERAQLHTYCQDAQRGIMQLVIKNKEDFEEKTKKRMEKIEYEMKAVLPEAPPQETENIKEIVQANFKDQEAYY
ncbi:unnamed protein product [Tetraodon nigroviridis]|uniref:Chromosome 7 SCAF14703, whole genome shotgun sequence n=1 Tax=Tetraodon nigroviridis TaxID=99883 RepID=Q4S8R7_TETNG|nr:unnamed protein product [Tetraodon nigroviridis]